METIELLENIGLTEGEAKTYLALLKLGTTSVNRIKETTKLHRTNIYDFIEKLINKGLVNYHIQKNVRFYSAVSPEKLLEYLQEKEDLVKDFLPKLKSLQKTDNQELKVEVYKGREGIKTFFNDLIKTKKNYVAFGVNEEEWEEDYSILISQHFRKEKEAGIKAKILTSTKAKMIYEHGEYRYISEEFFSPIPTITYGNKICTIIWEPLTVIIISNKDLAESNRKYFELLWKKAKKNPINKVKIIKNQA